MYVLYYTLVPAFFPLYRKKMTRDTPTTPSASQSTHRKSSTFVKNSRDHNEDAVTPASSQGKKINTIDKIAAKDSSRGKMKASSKLKEKEKKITDKKAQKVKTKKAGKSDDNSQDAQENSESDGGIEVHKKSHWTAEEDDVLISGVEKESACVSCSWP